jgi:hypothetical protein
MSSADSTLRNDAVAAPARAVTNGGGRLGVLAEITAVLDEAPETLESLQAVAHGAMGATAADAVRLTILPADGGEPLVVSEGPGLDRGGPNLHVVLSTPAGRLGELVLERAPGRQGFADSDALFARTVAAHVCGSIEEDRLRRQPAPAHSKSRPVRSFFPGRKKV